MSDRLRILCVTSSYPLRPGDHAGAFVRTGLMALAARGHRVTVVHPHPGTDAEFRDDGEIRRIAVRIGRGKSALAYRGGMPERLSTGARAWTAAPRLVARLRAAALDLAPEHDVLLTHWIVPGGLVGASVRRATGLPHLCVLHSGGVSLLSRMPGGALLARRIAAQCDRFLAVSSSVAERMSALAGRGTTCPIDVVANPLPDAAFDVATARDAAGVLFVGRLERVKGLRTLLDALLPDDAFAVTVAGAGSQAGELRVDATQRRLRVEFVGVIDATRRAELLSRARVVVVPSVVLPGGRTEGAPTIIAEALAAGVPVVASRVGGIAEMIDDSTTGLLVPQGDPRALREAILRALSWDPGACSPACRQQAQRYRSDLFADALGRVFLGLLETRVA